MQDEPKNSSFLDARLVGGLNDIGCDQEIVVKKVGWKSIISVDASHTAGAQKDDLRAMRCHPILNFGLATQIQADFSPDRPAGDEIRAGAAA